WWGLRWIWKFPDRRHGHQVEHGTSAPVNASMLTLPAFQYHSPSSIDEAIALLCAHRGQVKVVAGGTDLLPNMKHRLFTPAHVVGLKGIEGLDQVKEERGMVRLGAMCTIAQLARDPIVQRKLPSLAAAASQIAGPQLREMGTLGGNLCLDTRCVYYNQTYFWRKALGFCLKKDGTVCHVVQTGRKCVAAASNDTAPVLITVDATIRVAGPRGVREIPIPDFYLPDGIVNTVLAPEELVIEVLVPDPVGVIAGYQKVRVRASIDYPALTIAVAAKLDSEGRIDWARAVISALGARPHSIRLEAFRGRPLTEEVIADIGLIAQKQCHPLTNINVDAQWRREMIPVFVRRAFAQARAVPPS
ncbi:MAG TPA: FAD binding domain-containing protein, partial [Myxococcaceae bacterium]|nr:FAD binding domain-containing protein [Myxococcaceae bacterium]